MSDITKSRLKLHDTIDAIHSASYIYSFSYIKFHKSMPLS